MTERARLIRSMEAVVLGWLDRSHVGEILHLVELVRYELRRRGYTVECTIEPPEKGEPT